MFLETEVLVRMCREGKNTSMKTGLTLFFQHSVEHENITQCAHTCILPMRVNCSCFPFCTDSQRQHSTSKTRAAWQNCYLNTYLMCVSVGLTCRVKRPTTDCAGLNCGCALCNAVWIIRLNLFYFFLFFPQEDYTDKGQVKVQRKYELNLSLMFP